MADSARNGVSLLPDGWGRWDHATLDVRLRELSERAMAFALPPVSDFRVGVAALGASGKVYLGANLEFPSANLGLTVHGEQSAVSMALSLGESSIDRIAVNAPPCGHCRQFLLETGSDPWIVLPDAEPTRLSSLLPQSFGPTDLGAETFALQPGRSSLGDLDLPIGQVARLAAERSHAPYSNCPAGVALQLEFGSVVAGSYVESAAFNPSLDAARAALAVSLMSGWPGQAITSAHLVATNGAVDHEQTLGSVLAAAGLSEIPTSSESL